MFPLYLPYFYNLPVALLLVYYVVNRLEKYFFAFFPETLALPYDLGADIIFYLKMLIIFLPALTAATHFFMRFYHRRDLDVRQTVQILVLVQLLSALLPGFLF
ncbi:MAG: hypothetical protein AAF840_03230 [Bacteroidota bacterium]